ncbi:MAG: phosphoglycolate phosphatase [Patescibacteria group bacterium]|jgi:phosphoglycolate phosphatase-like HAD superfamily hydrolase|nr:phosphoglycolate phosphatase [Patescibacteria group bacterium]MDQ5970026.1 phosphoglycolate phosphatase [Patescibacteria group bacterium]
MKISNVKAIVWDLDGTLIDSFDISQRILEKIAVETGKAVPTRETTLLHYHSSLPDTLKNVFNLTDSELPKFLDIFLEKQDKVHEGDADSHLFKDALALSKRASKLDITQIVLTNRAHKGKGYGLASPKEVVGRSALAAYIAEVICGDEVEFRKPDARSLSNWLENNHIDPRDILVIGDQFVDATLASNIGARSLIIERNGQAPHLKDRDAVLVVNSFDEVEIS